MVVVELVLRILGLEPVQVRMQVEEVVLVVHIREPLRTCLRNMPSEGRLRDRRESRFVSSLHSASRLATRAHRILS